MLKYSENAIKFFNKNIHFFNSKNQIYKYEMIIKRILNYIQNLFRDVLNNADLSICNKKNNINEMNEINETNEININIENVTFNEEPLNENIDNKIYNNFNILYFNKYLNKFEYYQKYKIKCKCMKVILNYIYNKSLNDEKKIYIDDYNFLENFYISTRLKILNHNILIIFDSFSNKCIYKYIKNICLLGIYISNLEKDLFFYIFNNYNPSINIILNTIALSLYEHINENVYNLNNIEIIRKIIQIICTDIIETYNGSIDNILMDYLKTICRNLKERLIYIVELYISYYTKNISQDILKEIPYNCFKPIKKKIVNIINDFLFKNINEMNNDETININDNNIEKLNSIKNKENDKYKIDIKKEYLEKSIENSNPSNVKEKIIKTSFDNILLSESSDSIESQNKNEYNINYLDQNNVYKSFNFNNFLFNKNTKFILTGIDVNVIGTIIILKTINFILDENIFVELFNECLENCFNSLHNMYKHYIKESDDLFNGSLYLIKNLSLLLYLFYNITKNKNILNFYLNKEFTQNLLFHQKDKINFYENVNIKQNQILIFSFLKKIYKISNCDIHTNILNLFNESIYNLIITIISKVCSPLIKILSTEFKQYLINEEKIQNILDEFMKSKINQHNENDCIKNFNFLNELNFDILENFIKEIININNKKIDIQNKQELKNNLQSFRQKIYFLFPKIYFYIKLFLYTNVNSSTENEDTFFHYLFNYIIGILKYKIIYLLSEVYIILHIKYNESTTIIDNNYINDLFLFLNNSSQYTCVFSDIHEYYELNKNYNFLYD